MAPNMNGTPIPPDIRTDHEQTPNTVERPNINDACQAGEHKSTHRNGQRICAKCRISYQSLSSHDLL